MERAKYALWLICLIAFGFLFVSPVFESVQSDDIANYKHLRRVRSLKIPQLPGNVEDLIKFLESTNVTSIIQSALDSVSNLTDVNNRTTEFKDAMFPTGNLTESLFDILNSSILYKLKEKYSNVNGNISDTLKLLEDSSRNSPIQSIINSVTNARWTKDIVTPAPSSIRIEIVNGRNSKSENVLKLLNERIGQSCSIFTSQIETISSCLSSILKEVAGSTKNSTINLNGTCFHLVFHVSVENNVEVIVFQLSFGENSTEMQGQGQQIHSLELEYETPHQRKPPQLPSPALFPFPNSSGKDLRKPYRPMSIKNNNWNVFSRNKHLQKSIIVSTYPPPQNRKSKYGTYQNGGGMFKKNRNNNNYSKGFTGRGGKG